MPSDSPVVSKTSDVIEVLQALPSWGPVVTIVQHCGSVFEFKGDFPEGTLAHGHLNLDGPVPGFHGHLRLDSFSDITFQDRLHRGRESLALVFWAGDEVAFKVFLGRDEQGELLTHQRQRFQEIRENWT